MCVYLFEKKRKKKEVLLHEVNKETRRQEHFRFCFGKPHSYIEYCLKPICNNYEKLKLNLQHL